MFKLFTIGLVKNTETESSLVRDGFSIFKVIFL